MSLGKMRNVCYKNFDVLDDVVTIRMSHQLEVVGLTTWEAGYYLSEFILAQSSLFQGKCCLELGSGIGFTGIILYKYAKSSKIIFSDYEYEILQNIETNCLINQIHITKEVQILEVDWLKEDYSSLISFHPQVIIAADVVYDKELIIYLVKLINFIICNQTETIAYIASTVRNPDTFQYFINELDKYSSLSHREISMEYQIKEIFNYIGREKMSLTEIKFKQ